MTPFKDIAAYLVEVVNLINDNADGITGSDIIIAFNNNHPEIPTEQKKKIFNTVSFDRSLCKNVGWLRYDEGRTWRWFITDAGKAALKQYPSPEDFSHAAKNLWKRQKQLEAGDAPKPNEKNTEVALQAVAMRKATSAFEEAQETAQESITNYLLNMSEYTFQDVIADLLTAMGYHVDWVSPPGPDGGCDIVAFSDALGVTKPIIKVQAKRWKSKIGAPDLKSFAANIMDGESGICICLGGFTGEAEKYARDICNRNLTLIAQERFVQLWIANYDKLTDKAKERFRLEPIYYVRPSV